LSEKAIPAIKRYGRTDAIPLSLAEWFLEMFVLSGRILLLASFHQNIFTGGGAPGNVSYGFFHLLLQFFPNSVNHMLLRIG
jgi:hypothetical protein